MRLAAVLMALVMISGCISWPFGETHRTGFKEDDLTMPGEYNYSLLQTKPPAKLPYSPSIPKQPIYLNMGRLYVNYGGISKRTLKNPGPNDIFLYNYSIRMGDSEWKWQNEKGMIIKKGEEENAYLWFGGVNKPGKYYDYQISFSHMINNVAGMLPYPREMWHDIGASHFSENDFSNLSYIEINPYSISSVYTSSKNYYYYFDRINDMVKPFDLTVYQKAREITLPFSGPYNIFQVCTIFDYLVDDLKYIQDPDGNDVWSDPITTLSRGGGDCEDYAMLSSALVSSIGGTTRIYMTDNHAFSTLYIGNSTESKDMLEEIDAYYGTNLFFAVLEDKFGYWLVADPLGSFFLGGLPVGGDAVGPPGDNHLYNWDFTETGHVNIIDVMRK